MAEMEPTPDAASARPATPRPSRPAALMLHPYQPLRQWDGGGAELQTAPPFRANPMLRLAVLAVLAQAVLAALTGIGLINGAISPARIGSGVTLTAGSMIAMRFGIGILVIAVLLVMFAALTVDHWQAARGALVVVETIALGVTLAAHFGGGSVLGFVTVVAMGVSGSALIPFGAVIGVQAFVVYALALHPATYRAFTS